MSITENVRAARRKINAAAESAGRSGSEVRLLAATKMNGPEAVQEAIVQSGLPADIRGERLTLEELALLAQILHP